MDMVSNPEGAPPVCYYTMYLFKVYFKCIIQIIKHTLAHMEEFTCSTIDWILRMLLEMPLLYANMDPKQIHRWRINVLAMPSIPNYLIINYESLIT